VGPAHGSNTIRPFQNLNLANSAAALSATDLDPAFEAYLRATQHGLIVRARKYVGRAFDPNLKFQRFTPPAGFLTLLLKSPSSIGAQIPSRKPYQPFSVNSFLGTNLKMFFWETHGVL
jgi:hypothetical protein